MESGTPRDRSRRSASKDRIGEDVQAIHATHREKPPNRNFVTEYYIIENILSCEILLVSILVG